jgi:hypothetical protein
MIEPNAGHEEGETRQMAVDFFESILAKHAD